MLTMGRSKELSRVRASHMEVALQKHVKTEPVNAVTTAPLDKKKARPGSSNNIRTCYTCGGPYPHQDTCPAHAHVVVPRLLCLLYYYVWPEEECYVVRSSY
ncbi:hypothetical protein NDU88_011416 [Pleurodeles waltl]|uniref:Uncharacterized protein n=1 Tax=Pleurodeles waltl TaxID=8319 RepID=A0AAV7QX67_PLEWA|nr:hypothetical protein NDU88_011416 [Pleurodeles waltl]